MSSYVITGDEFASSGLRVEESVYEPIIRLEKGKHGLRKAEDGEIQRSPRIIKIKMNRG